MLRLALSATLCYIYSKRSNGFKVKYCTQSVMLKATIMPATLAEAIDEKKNCYVGINWKTELEKNKDSEPGRKKKRVGLWTELSL